MANALFNKLTATEEATLAGGNTRVDVRQSTGNANGSSGRIDVRDGIRGNNNAVGNVANSSISNNVNP